MRFLTIFFSLAQASFSHASSFKDYGQTKRKKLTKLSSVTDSECSVDISQPEHFFDPSEALSQHNIESLNKQQNQPNDNLASHPDMVNPGLIMI
jgi:hypothetical protein